jgi:hypothetical protein
MTILRIVFKWNLEGGRRPGVAMDAVWLKLLKYQWFSLVHARAMGVAGIPLRRRDGAESKRLGRCAPPERLC